jgi:uncharacterized DUF497 family protein
MQGLAFEWNWKKETANFGMSSERKLLVVVHITSGAQIRIISARLATRNETRTYKETPL